MRHFKFYVFAVLSIVFFSCNQDDSNQDEQQQQQDEINSFTSSICDNPSITGIEALYWDYAHGLPVPLTQIPTLSNPGTQFIHSQYPILGFIMPQGYTAFEITDPNTQSIGVNVIRDDNQVVWRYVPTTTVVGDIDIDTILASEINAMFAFYNHTGNFEVVCSTTDTANNGTFQSTFGARLLRFGNHTALVWANKMFDPSLGITFVSVSISAAPTAEFNAVVFETYLPISFQLLYIDNDVRDSDLDGTPDNQDNHPFDPDRQ